MMKKREMKGFIPLLWLGFLLTWLLTSDASAQDTLAQKTSATSRKVVKFISGKQQDDLSLAKQLYLEGDQLFRQASTEQGAVRKKTFAAAAKKFGKSSEAAEGEALEQDALFMKAESLFFADQLTAAMDAYQRLQKDHPRNRHNDRAAARLFTIGQYWIETAKVDEKSWFPLNLTDRSRPRLDADGHAIRVLDQIRYDDPTGRLSDDATMLAASDQYRQKKYEEADEFLTDLRQTYSDSEHLFSAHMLGIDCKLNIYRGPAYSGLVLDEADKLIQQTRRRFPDRLREENYGEIVARSAAKVAYLRSERYLYRANWNEKKNQYGAAAIYYQLILEEFGDTPQADIARARLTAIQSKPAEPTMRLGFLTKIFPDDRVENPLKMKRAVKPETQPGSQPTPPPETILR